MSRPWRGLYHRRERLWAPPILVSPQSGGVFMVAPALTRGSVMAEFRESRRDRTVVAPDLRSGFWTRKSKWGRHRCRPHSHRRVVPGGNLAPGVSVLASRKMRQPMSPGARAGIRIHPTIGSAQKGVPFSRSVCFRFRSRTFIMVRRFFDLAQFLRTFAISLRRSEDPALMPRRPVASFVGPHIRSGDRIRWSTCLSRGFHRHIAQFRIFLLFQAFRLCQEENHSRSTGQR